MNYDTILKGMDTHFMDMCLHLYQNDYKFVQHSVQMVF
jgi:hypothetical protein